MSPRKRLYISELVLARTYLVDVSLDFVHVELELAEVRQRGEVSRLSERRRGGVGEEDGGGQGADEEGDGALREYVTFAIFIIYSSNFAFSQSLHFHSLVSHFMKFRCKLCMKCELD